MYVYFFPAQNFLKKFPANNRPIYNVLAQPGANLLAKALQKHFNVGIVSRASPGSNYSFFLGPVSSAPAYLIRKLPDKIRDISPRCFISLIPDINNPIVWIGGKSVSDFLQTAEFLKDMLPCLLQNNLIAGDFHIHTTASDGKTKPEEVCCFAAQAGLDAIAVTDHHSVNGAKKVRTAAPAGFPVLIGEEATDSRGNHLLVYGIKNSIIKGITPKTLINKWFFAGLPLAQAHPTDQTYFMIKGDRAVGVEVFNFLSSSPRIARDYAERALKKGCRIAVLGCSDAHLPQDIGKAKTYLLVSHFNPDAILQSISGGETVAFYQGNFCGKEPFRELLSNLYLHSNLLGGKLIPLSKMTYYGFPYLKNRAKCFAVKKEREIWCQLALPFKQGVINIETDGVLEGYLDNELIIFQNNGGRFPFYQSRGPGRLTLRLENKKKTSVSLTPSGRWLSLKPENHPPAKRIFCPSRICRCREKWFSLKQYRFPFLLDCGGRQRGRIKFNSLADDFLFHQGMATDIKPFLAPGKNEIKVFDKNLIRKFNPRLYLGKELQNWEIKMGKSSWRRVACACNLQSLGIVPINYLGEITYRAVFNLADFPCNNPALFFEGIDGDVNVKVNGESLMQRGSYHWEDAFEVSLKSFSKYSGSLELIVHINKNEAGLCGITNLVYLGEIIYLKYPLTTVHIHEGQQEIQLLRCGEDRVRAFLCDDSGTAIRFWLAGSPSHPMLVENHNKAVWLVLNSFGDSLPSYQPKIAPLTTPCVAKKRLGLESHVFG